MRADQNPKIARADAAGSALILPKALDRDLAGASSAGVGAVPSPFEVAQVPTSSGDVGKPRKTTVDTSQDNDANVDYVAMVDVLQTLSADLGDLDQPF